MNFFETLRADIALFLGLRRTLKAYESIEKATVASVGADVERIVDLNADRVAIRFEGADMTYRQFDMRANAYANWALAQGLKKGDAVALLMGNRPDYVCAWIGLAKIGVIVGLINTNLTGAALAHAVNIADAQHVLLSADLAPAFAGAAASLTRAPKPWVLDGFEGMASLDEALAAVSTERPDKALREAVTLEDTALYVYTSGTTGAPKAAKMLHRRVLGMMRAFIGGAKAKPTDRVYVTLPLYHGTGGLCGVGFALTTGATLIIRRKFSATHFWTDCAAEGATVFFYIGELCRYLVNQPPSPADTAHKLRCGIGNGLRGEVWEKFQKRFNIPKILEFYGSTEGNTTLLNFDNKPGAIGRIPKWLQSRVNVRIVKFDTEEEQVVRGPDGLCIEAGPDETGEAVGEIRSDEARYRFEGYTGDPVQTERKILRDVFVGYFYFVDHRDVQIPQGRSGARRLRSGEDRRANLVRSSRREALRARDAGTEGRDRSGQVQAIT